MFSNGDEGPSLGLQDEEEDRFHFFVVGSKNLRLFPVVTKNVFFLVCIRLIRKLSSCVYLFPEAKM